MKIFLDTIEVETIKQLMPTGLVDGITTNPTLLSKAHKNAKETILKICQLVPGDVSVEVTEKSAEMVYTQAKKIAQLAQNVVVKIPCHVDYYPIIKRLVDEGVALNITLVFSLPQSLMMSKLGVRYISPFVGRWDDNDVEGIDILFQMRDMIDTYGFKTKILAASIRTVRHFHNAIEAGCDVTTLPIHIFEKSISHVLTNSGIKQFDADWETTGLKTFP